MTSNPRYRPDIDGLRAIAVLFVVCYHLGFEFIPGGFIGVDIFFVISGFLITGIIHRQMVSGAFSFTMFYTRRIRRILPAFLVVCLTSSFAAFILFLPRDILQYAESLTAATLFVSNFYFLTNTTGYFSQTIETLPLLHTWSLAVEEQFYFLWPCILLLAHKFVSRRNITVTVMLLFILSLLLSHWITVEYSEAAYYLLPGRFFELLLGACAALLLPSLPKLPKQLIQALSLAGLALIIVPALILNKHSFFPSYNALWPCLGAFFLIVTGAKDRGLISRVLGSPPFVAVGLISYSLYLWHWPVIAFLHYGEIELEPAIQFSVLGVTIGLSVMSWRFVEQPFRHAKQLSFKRNFASFVLMPLALVLGFFTVIYTTNGLPYRLDKDIIEIHAAMSRGSRDLRPSCVGKNVPKEDTCLLGDLDNVHTDVLLVGDSHANSLVFFLDELLIDADLKGFEVTVGGGAFFAGTKQYRLRNGDYVENKGFLQKNNRIIELISAKNYRYVVIAGGYLGYIDSRYLAYEADAEYVERNRLETLKQAFAQTIRVILDSGAIPVVIKDYPPAGHRYNCLLFNKLYGVNEDCDLSKEYVDKRDRKIDQVLDELGARFKEIVFIDTRDVICDERSCYTSFDGVPLYHDKSHLNPVGSRLLGRRFLERFDNPFLFERSLLND